MRAFAWNFVAALSGLLLSISTAEAQTRAQMDFFEKRVRPVLAENCYACHSGQLEQPMSGLRLDSLEGVLHGGDRGPALVPGNPSQSRLIQAVRHQTLAMPPTGKLEEAEIAALERWVEMGAPWPESAAPAEPATAANAEQSSGEAAGHWAFQPVEAASPPETGEEWAATAIDEFILPRLRDEGLSPSPRASPRVLLRRLSYDLTGLPPEPERIEAFAAGPSPAAYEREVDRLLASPHFGERWARHWLDVARYAEAGSVNVRFAFAYTYRGWVIRAFNEDMPYDRFVTLQLAADKLPGEDRRHLAALGFLTLGLNPFRRTNFPDKIDDRIDVVSRGLQGLTVSCARCHDHKFDPIPTEDYYSLYGVFANTEEPLQPTPIAKATPSRKDADSELARFYQERLRLRIETLRKFERERLAEHRAEARQAESIAKYLKAAWQGRDYTGPQLETLSKEANLNLYLLERWRRYLKRAIETEDPVFLPWAKLASRFEQERAAQAEVKLASRQAPPRANPLVLDALQADPPETAGELAARYGKLLAESDSAEPHSDPDREALRLALHGEDAPPNMPQEDFWQIQSEGDKNTVNNLIWQHKGVLADYAYRVAPPHAMSARDTEEIEPAHVFVRGNQNNLGRRVPRRFLRVLSGPERRPFRNGSGRLELARAIANEENPLTARVFVNRVWHHLFGRGLVETPSDFGTRGAAPAHPELLDYLADAFIEDGWSVKSLIRRIVLSNVYQQASADRPEARAADPQNRLLWRMNRRRLDFEALRDSLLAAAGRLDRSVGGPSFLLGAQPSVPRRTLYAFVERQRTLPQFRNFDLADPEQHTPRRHLTTVPQQALFMMNSPFLAEQARHLVRRVGSEAGNSGEARIQAFYRRIFSRPASPEEVKLGLAFVRKARNAEAEAQDRDSVPPPEAAWRYGTGELDPQAGEVRNFRPFRFFAPVLPIGFGQKLVDAWKASSLLPSPAEGRAHLTASGGAPGDDLNHSVIRRWVSPIEGKVNISGTLRHGMDPFERRFDHSNGVRGWIVSARSGTLASWTLRDLEAGTVLRGLPVKKGETLDFVVDSRGDYESDSFIWAPVIEEALEEEEAEASREPRRWSAEEDFRGPRRPPLSPWEQYAQVLLETNEFTFLD